MRSRTVSRSWETRASAASAVLEGLFLFLQGPAQRRVGLLQGVNFAQDQLQFLFQGIKQISYHLYPP